MRPVVFSQMNLAGVVDGVEVVEPLQQALVELLLQGEGTEDLGAELHVVPGQHQPGGGGVG